MKFFNTAGPTKPEMHYHIDPISHVHWDELEKIWRDARDGGALGVLKSK